MKTQARLLVVIFVTILLIGAYFIINQRPNDNQIEEVENKEITATIEVPEIENSNTIVVNGLLYTSGNLSFEADPLLANLVTDYQVTLLEDKPNGIEGYFLLVREQIGEDNEFGKYFGKCVRVTGSIATGWEERRIEESYSRLPLDVETISESDVCKGYLTSGTAFQKPDGAEKGSFSGLIISANRPSPDISYDYELVLDKPFIDKQSASGLDTEVNSIIISPSTNEIWKSFNQSQNSKVKVQGYWVWGFAESRFFVVETIIKI